uniref:Glycosyl hydrolase family 13 catalytic domain-containing protein n=1 Tax=Arion vulgaris TaxID=1028688 RepID=A0A0B7B5B9_9EUPU
MESMPDLNLRSTKVREALKNILKFWLELGVDGFYIRHADYLFEDYDLRDGIYNETNVNLTLLAGDVVNNNKFMRGLTENFDMFARWRAFLDDYGNMTNQYRILFADVDSSFEHVRKYYGMFNRDGVDFPLNEFSLHLNDTTVAEDIRNIVQNWTDNMAKNHWPNWMGGNDRTQRLVDRLGAAAGPYLILIMLLPGTPYVYYGDEIGLSAVNNISSTQQHQTMGLPMRGLQQWNNNTYAGFCMQGCSSAPWMNTNPEYKNQMNVEAQKKDLGSVWNLFRNLTILRKENPAFEYGDYAKGIQDDEVFSFVREYDGQHGFLVALNFVNKTVNKAYTGVHETIPGSAKVELVTGAGATHSKGDNADLTNLPLAPFEGIVVSWDYQAKEL